MEQTLVIIKPDGVERNLIGSILNEYERNGLVIKNIKMLVADEELAKEHYDEHVDKPFFNDLVDYITSGPSCVLIIEGENAIDRVRKINGATNPKEAQDNTIRALYGLELSKNTVHASDSQKSAKREISIWFA
ncbi:MAG TPA: nucleoside-diphosphate kinase [Alloiococcus sp.]|nr:nucleoside-diphosphate kinase [Alloiococcus sp.]